MATKPQVPPDLMPLPNGRWIDPLEVARILPLEASEDYPGIVDRVMVVMRANGLTEGDRIIIDCASMEDARLSANDIAEDINRRWQALRESISRTIPVDQKQNPLGTTEGAVNFANGKDQSNATSFLGSSRFSSCFR